jgi:hypothetical protein
MKTKYGCIIMIVSHGNQARFKLFDLCRICLFIFVLAVLSGCSSSGGSSAGDTDTGGGDTHTVPSTVSAPVLRNTLPASWDENWFSSPSVFDLDTDGNMEIIAARASVLYVWSASGAMLWRAPVGESSTSGNDHGSHRQYASPVVGDLDNDGYGEIAIAYSNKVAVYNRNGILKTGWPQSFPGYSDEIRSIAATDLEIGRAHV